MRILIRRTLIFVGLSALTLSIIVPMASAHYMWINARDYRLKPGKQLKVILGWGHLFPTAGPMSQKDLERLYLIGPNGERMDLKPISDREYRSGQALKRGTYLVVADRKGGFFTKTTEGYKRQPKKGLTNVIECFWSEMHAKAIVNVGKRGGGEVSRVLGHTLEIIPLKDPGRLHGGDYLPVKVLFKGEPLKTTVYATYAGFSKQKDTFAYTTRADEEGIARIRLLKKGIWLVKVSHKVPYPNPEECDWESYTATLTFKVK